MPDINGGPKNAASHQIHANRKWGEDNEMKDTRTIRNPVAFPGAVLSQRNELQPLLALGIGCIWWCIYGVFFLVFVLCHAPSAIDNVLYLGRMRQLHVHE